MTVTATSNASFGARSAARILVDALAHHGVDTVFGIPGTHNIPIYGALADVGIRHVLMRHEQGCAYAADGYARVSRRPGVVITTTGPGLLNSAAALAQSMSDSVPVLVISPGMPTNHPALGTGELHEMRSQSATLSSIVKSSYRVQTVEEIPATVAACFVDMLAGRPRPVHLELPFDLLHWGAEVRDVDPVQLPKLRVEEKAVSDATAILTQARRPLIIAGGGVGAEAAPQLKALAEYLGAPVVTTFNGKGCFPENHQLSAGAGLGRPAIYKSMAEADVILAVGTELAPSDLWYGRIPEKRLIRIDVDPHAVLRNARAEVTMVAEAGPALAALRAELASTVHVEPLWAARVIEAAKDDASTKAQRWMHLIEGLTDAVDADSIIVGDSTMACYYGVGSTVPLAKPHHYLYPTGFGTLGYGLPASVGAALAAPDSRIVCIEGDGGLMFSVNELTAAAHLGLALPVIVVTNGGYGEIRRQMAETLDTVHAVDFAPPRLQALAEAFGCHYLKATDATSIAKSMSAAWAADCPTIIEIPEDHA
ncbi:thiamine pyrophosphate-binding protein [Rhodococcus globerulus]|uniref:thiamine pyrophosphate-binding protein n=1 Tax=Rhodococcus globerulus TaxID=33008 RepID=UPI00068C2FA2|nr:thiamine pyrophosphate-binding protein [Rhodococcus globerulus]PVX59585.1 acetolactate synthase-1/2/3 large subunit [Rhodococcus globerulus]